MYLQRKNEHCIFILSVLFCSETETRIIFCTRGTSLGAKSGLSDELSQKMFPITSPGNENVCLGPRDLSEFGFKFTKICRHRKKSTAKFWQKKSTFLGHESFLLLKLKL